MGQIVLSSVSAFTIQTCCYKLPATCGSLKPAADEHFVMLMALSCRTSGLINLLLTCLNLTMAIHL
jgi:hypothetical protein